MTPATATSTAGSTAPSVASSTAVAVYPAPGTRTASPQTQISIRGIAADRIGTITADGSKSGPHTGTLKPDSDGDGASFYPDKPFDAGETVTVHTALKIIGAASGSYSFTVSHPEPDKEGQRTSETPPADVVQHFASAPSLQPPTLTVTTGSLKAADGDIFLSPKAGPGQYGPMIVDSEGQLVWFDPLPVDQQAWDFHVQHYRGKPVLTWWQGAFVHGHGRGVAEIYDEQYQPVATIHAGNGYTVDAHDFVITSANTALFTVYQPVQWDLTSVGGPKDGVVYDGIAQEIDIPTGNVLAEWHALDHVSLTDSYYGQAKKDTPYDFFHINSVDLRPDGQLLISARATHAVYDVNLATGDIIWQLGGKHSTFSGNGTAFSSQHDARWDGSDSKITLFDNAAGVGDPTAPHSSGMIISLDKSKHTATADQRFVTDTVPRAASQGNAELLPDGGMFLGYGAQPYLAQFDAAGKLIWQAQIPPKYASYRAFRAPWTGHPTTKPAAVASVSGTSTTVKVSWNGATEVASWRVLGASSAAELTASGTSPSNAVASGPRTGFETSLTISGTPPAYLAVQALDAQGKVLGTSPPVQPARS